LILELGIDGVLAEIKKAVKKKSGQKKGPATWGNSQKLK